jgi:lipopolysaccharide transport system ATP-binding protein
MSEIAIRCKGLSKQYRIGRQERYKALRDVLTDAATAPFRRLRRATSSSDGNGIGKPKPETIWALDDVSFEIKQGEVVGVIGRNGAGKTTLLKILSRITKPTKGHAEIHGHIGALLEVGTGFHPELTGRENIYLNGSILGMRKSEIDARFDEIVAFAEVERFIDTPVKRYSTGMQVRLAFAVAAHLEPEILLVDEVLAVGDAAFQKKCLGKMGEVASEGRTVLFVSHNMAAIRRLCSKTLFLQSGGLAGLSDTSSIVTMYENSYVEERMKDSSVGTIFEEGIDPARDFQVLKIEMLDQHDRAKQTLATWDHVKFRLHYHARYSIRSGSAEFRVSTMDGTPLLFCSTTPDSNVSMEIARGIHYVDCEFASWPLSAGRYLVGAALAIPMKEWLTSTDRVGLLEVDGKDVFASGMLMPHASRALLAVPHEWKVEPTDVRHASQ